MVLVPGSVAAAAVFLGGCPAGATAAGGVLLAGELGVAAAYWRAKRNQVRTSAPSLTPALLRALGGLRIAGGMALILVAALLMLLAGRGSSPSSDMAVGGVLWCLAALEHVNLFSWQLAHGSPSDWRRLHRTRRLRRSFLANDLRRVSAGADRRLLAPRLDYGSEDVDLPFDDPDKLKRTAKG